MRKTAEQTLRILDGGNHTRDSPWDIREIEVAVAQAFAKITGIKYYQGLKEGMVGLDSVALIEFVDQMPTKDQFGNIYIDLPAEPISFGSRWQHGINHVGPYSGSLARDLETSFKLIHTTTTPIWANTVNQVNVGQQRIELVGTNRLNFLDLKEVCPLRIRLFSAELGEDAKIPDDMAPDVIKMVLELYQNRPRDQKDNTESEPTNLDGDR